MAPPTPQKKSSSSFSFSNLLTSHNDQNRKPTTPVISKPYLPTANKVGGTGVAGMIQAYEVATLRRSTGAGSGAGEGKGGGGEGRTKVPASFFQQAQLRKSINRDDSKSTPRNLEGKENAVVGNGGRSERLPLVLALSTSTNRPPPPDSNKASPTKSIASSYTSTPSSPVSPSKSTARPTTTKSRPPSLILNIPIPSPSISIPNSPTKATITLHTPLSSPTKQTREAGPAITPKSPARASRFREELPRPVYTSPLMSPLVYSAGPELIPVPEVKKVGGRRRASTVTSATTNSTIEKHEEEEVLEIGNGFKSPAMTFVDGYEEVVPETREERIIRLENEFEGLLDTMQLPSKNVRDRMLTLTVELKEEMLRASANSNSPATTPKLQSTFNKSNRKRTNSNVSSKIGDFLSIRRSKSSQSLASSNYKNNSNGSKGKNIKYSDNPQPTTENYLIPSPITTSSNKKPTRPKHSRSQSATSVFLKSLGITSSSPTTEKELGWEISTNNAKEDPAWWAVRLRSTKCSYAVKQGKIGTDLKVEELAILRARLRAESPSWVEEFLRCGGYQGLLERLKELLDLEWREEQHDDFTLHELLRCFKALSLTDAGKNALASRCPIPFTALANLLFSDKKPGDLAPRQILVELILSLFEIYPISARLVEGVDWNVNITNHVSLNHGNGSGDKNSGGRRYLRKMKGSDGDREEEEIDGEGEEEISDERKSGTHEFVRSLMMGKPDEEKENQLEFITESHRPRQYKTWVKELGDTVRDYFWVFCHAQNMIWSMEVINPDNIEAPKVPSGMTGGVEHDAMLYCASHFKLINAIARSCPERESAMEFHIALFESGLERIIMTLRRASQDFYAILHLELARYIDLARLAGFNLGPKIFERLDVRLLSASERHVLVEYNNQRRANHQVPKGTPQLAAIKF